MKRREPVADHIPSTIILESVLAYASELMILLDADCGLRILNPAAEKFFHWTIDNVMGKNFWQLCQEHGITCPIPKEYFKHPSLLNINLDCKNGSGRSFNLNWTISPIVLSGESLNGALIIGKDIEFKKNNIAFHLNGIINAIPGCLYWKDCDGHYLGCNNLTAKLAGLASPSEVMGKTDAELWGEDTLNLTMNDRQVVSTGKAISVEETLKTANGELLYFTGVKMPLFDEHNHIIGVIGNALDITELKKTQAALKTSKEAAEAANEAKTEFLENMRHDVRTPLSGIVGFSELLKSESSEPRIKEYADNLIASSHALLHLMDEVLEAVRVSSGDIPLLKRKFDLKFTMERVVALYQARAHEKKLHLSLSLDKALPHYVIGDNIRLHRIALELIGNALNFTDEGHVNVQVELAKKENRELIIKMTVSDSGMGIPKDKQQDIYLQFKRLTPSYQGIYKGAGLGLYVVKQFIDELGGEIYVESKPSKGTHFTCLIPMQSPLLDDSSGIDAEAMLNLEKFYTPLQNQVSIAVSDNSSLSRDKISVLVVEDNFIAQTVAKHLLTSLCCHVDVARNGQEALNLYDKNHYDLIFMDIGLGDGMDGYEVTHHIRSNINATQHTSIIALTAHGADESKQRCIEAGMDAVLTKPLTQAHAIDILKSFLPQHHETPVAPQKMRRDLPDTDDEMFQLTQFPILSNDEAMKNCGTQEMLNELLTLMSEELPTDLECMKKAFKNQDYPLIEKIAHKIKGGAVYVGTTRMKYACQYVERYWKTGQRDLFDALYNQAVNTIEETITYINGWLRNSEK